MLERKNTQGHRSETRKIMRKMQSQCVFLETLSFGQPIIKEGSMAKALVKKHETDFRLAWG